jgi:hypothetical protein
MGIGRYCQGRNQQGKIQATEPLMRLVCFYLAGGADPNKAVNPKLGAKNPDLGHANLIRD